MGAIDIGVVAEDRISTWSADKTLITKNNPANADGTIDTFKVWAEADMTGFRAGTFDFVSGTSYKCRDSEAIGNVTSGSEQTFTGLTCDVVTGDYAGCYFATGTIEKDSFGYAGVWYTNGEYIDPNDQTSYDLSDNDALSLYGTGQTPVVAPTVTTQAASSVEITTATGNGNITATGGENCDHRGIVYGKTSKGDPGNTAYNATEYDDYEDEADGFGTGAFTRSLTGLDAETQYFARAYAHNSAGYAYGGEIDFTTEALPVTHEGAATLSGVGTLSGIGHITAIGKATLSGIGTLAVIGTTGVIQYGAAVLSGIGTLAGKGVITAIGKATLAGTGALSVLGGFLLTAKATLSGVGTLSAIGRRIFAGAATLTGQGTLATKGVLTVIGKAVLVGVGSLAGQGIRMTEATLQPTEKDTLLSQFAPTNNYGIAAGSSIRSTNNRAYRLVLEFDISSIPPWATITSASLQLYYYTYQLDDPVGKTAWAYKLTRTNWVELEATWNIYKTGSDWTLAGGDYVTSDPSGGSTTFPADYGWMSWDVLAIVQSAYGSSEAAEFLVKFETENEAVGSLGTYYTRDYTTDPDLQPKLVIEYTVEGFIRYASAVLSGIGSLSAILSRVPIRGLQDFTGRILSAFTGRDLSDATPRDQSDFTGRDLADDNDEFREVK